MKLGIIVKGSFILTYLLIATTLYLKYIQSEQALSFFMGVFITSITFSLASIYEVRTSKSITASAKTNWTMGLLFLGNLVGFIYLLSARRRIVPAD